MIKTTINELDFETFKVKVEKLQKQAKKYGLEVPTYKVVGETYLPHPTKPNFTYKALELEIEDVNVVFEDWRVVCQIRKVSRNMKIQGKVIGNAFYYPLEEIPEFCYEKSPTLCEHCGKNIPNRNLTFILKNDKTGEYKQVGSTCVEKFVSESRNIASIINFLNNYTEFINDIPRSNDYGNMRLYLPTRDVLRLAADILQKSGWVSSWDASISHEEASVPKLLNKIIDGKWDIETEVSEELLDEIIKFNENRILSLENEEKLNESQNFQRNCSIQIVNPSVECVNEYLRYVLIGARDYFKQFTRKATKNEFYGNEKEKIHETFIVTQARCIETKFGESILLQLVNHDGYAFKSFVNPTTKFAEFIMNRPKDFAFESDATIKNHNEYKGDKTTMLTYFKNYKEL